MHNGKELQTHLELNWYDYGARFYDPQTCRFPCLDPLADEFHWVSPYNYAENSPIANIDLWGLQAFSVHYLPGPEEIHVKVHLDNISKEQGLQLNFKDINPSHPRYREIFRQVRHSVNDFDYKEDPGQVLHEGRIVASSNLLNGGDNTPEFSLHLDVTNDAEYEDTGQGILKGGMNGNRERLLDMGNLSLSAEEYDKVEIYTDGSVTVEEVTKALADIGINVENIYEVLSESKRDEANNLEIHFLEIKENKEEE